MKREIREPYVFSSISELHRALNLPKPLHPLISLVDYSKVKSIPSEFETPLMLNFYKISYKSNFYGKIKYGQSYYDFDEGGLFFIALNQILSSSLEEKKYAGYTLLIHPDFFRNYALGKNIKNYHFFSYSANEALHLSEKEKNIIFSVFENIERELTAAIDDFSQDVMISYIEVLPNYSNRFYKRQFITRKAVNNDLLEKVEQLLNSYFRDEIAVMKGLPTVQFLSDELNVSPHYLSDVLRSLTALNAQQHIHQRLIEEAKEHLSSTNLTVAEIAYRLGFERPQSFNKLFKNKTRLSPLEFRESFN
ncbi:MAG: AraC family transcriptional regulator [Mucilaginibacter sp.]|nr:AraC family transcriptional regulator [Mucilaginibacter sp.]